MAIDATIKLFVDTTETPPYYWVEVSSDYDLDVAAYKHAGNAAFVKATNSEGNYDLELYLQVCPSAQQPDHPVVHNVMLGNLPTTGDECGIDIDVTLGGQRQGGGHPKLIGATQTSKPVPQVRA